MNSILVIGTMVLASYWAAENTTADNTTVTNETHTTVSYFMIVQYCSPDGGLNFTDAYLFITNVTEEGFIEQCDEHKAVWECVTNITNFVYNQINHNQDEDSVEVNILTGMGVLCNDPRVKPECIAEYGHSSREISTCKENAQTTEGSLQETAHYKCVENVLRKCDVGTFNVLAEHLGL